jgi:hypothetical protein
VNAFPQSNDRVVASISIAKSQGMTLRDYFAAQALQGIVNQSDIFWAGAAQLAYQYADAMMEARNAAQ